MGSPERIREVAKRVARFAREGHQLVVVPSAMSGETNRLLGARQGAESRSRARASSTSSPPPASRSPSACSAMALHERWASRRRAIPAGRCRILTDDAHTKARILAIEDENIRARPRRRATWSSWRASRASTSTDNITTLGRGGSDTTGVALAAALKADECQIYTDVDGVYTTDPRIVPEARRLDTVTFEEMLELASPGLQGAADPLGGIRRQVQGEAAGAVVVHAT